MLINNKLNVHFALKVTGKKFIMFLLFAFLIGYLSRFPIIHDIILFSPSLLAILGSGVGVFLAFRINSGYDRWWEARKIWGEMVNVSRSFGMSVTAMITNGKFSTISDEEKVLQKQLIYRHIGFVNSLRLHLRQNSEKEWKTDLWERKVNNMALVSTEERLALQQQFNIPAQILQKQSQEISAFFDGNPEKEFRYLKLIGLLETFYNIQGKSERIKNTVFPWGYAFYTHRLVWLMSILIPFGFIDNISPQSIFLSAVISTTFVTIEQVGRNLDNPFNNSFNDTPLSTLCRSIEIDLLEQLGEQRTDPLQAEGGVLN
jgi:putative membrane protein